MRRPLAAGLGCACMLAACTVDAPLVVRTEEPMLYVVLTPDTLVPADTVVTALLGTTGTPLRFEYRAAEQFIMRRASDGASFAWRELAIPADRVGPGHDFLPRAANYALADAGSGGVLGRRDLVPAEKYTLEISTGGRSVTGTATIPARPRLTVTQRVDGRRVVAWQRDPGVGGYVVRADTDAVPNHATADTFYVLRDDRAPHLLSPRPRFYITALDTNRARYFRDSRISTAGLLGAYGLFGAMSSASIDIPPRATSSASR